MIEKFTGWDIHPLRGSDRKDAMVFVRASDYEELRKALSAAADSLLSFRPGPGEEYCPSWTELDEVTLAESQRLGYESSDDCDGERVSTKGEFK
jgi:hypothetical protein